MRNFTLSDTLGITKACLALLPFVVAPGYVAGWALDLFEFRKRRRLLRLILAAPLTLAICPMLSYLLARFLPPGLWAFYLSMFAACGLLLTKELRRARPRSSFNPTLSKYKWIALGLIALWGISAVASLADLQIGDKVYPPIVAYDHSVRTVMTAALAHHVPPSNPFFANAAAPLRYHYLWLLFCSLPMKVFALSPRHVVYSGVVWCGLALICTVALGLKFLLRVETDIERKTLLGVGLLFVTGLDLLPTVYLEGVWHLWQPDMEKWNEPQITSWAGSLLWVPHHVAALIACFVAFLLLRYQSDSRRWGTGAVIVAGTAFASAAGMSVYVTFTFVVAVALWLLALAARKNWLELAMFAGSGSVAFGWALPFLLGLRGSASTADFAELALRPFPLGILLTRHFGIGLHAQPELLVANAIFLPINYALELGFFLAVGILRLQQLRRRKLEASANELAAWTLVSASFLIGTFLRSTSTITNDLGWRCFLPAQLILLLWGAIVVHDEWFPGAAATPAPRWGIRWTLAALVILGLLGTAHQVFMLRMFPILSDYGVIAGRSWVNPDRQFGKRAYALRSVYEFLNAQLPSSAVVQSNPATYDRILHVLYSGHAAAVATAAGDPPCGIAFGADPNLCAERLRRLTGLFEFADDREFDAVCRSYAIDAIVVQSSDRVWSQRTSWVWTRRPVIANDYAMAFRCGSAVAEVQH